MNCNPKVYTKSEHGICFEDIDADAIKVLNRLYNSGYEGRLVGGGVRDLLLGKKPKDFDIATDARPNELRRLFTNSRIIGKRFKLVHVYFSEQKVIEVATFRAASVTVEENDKISTLGSDNTFGTEESDAFRRDLTINGLFYDLHSDTVIDYVGGVTDLRSNLVRVIGDPEVRFTEDPVRMLRVVRHSVRAGFSVEERAWLAIATCSNLLELCTPIRLFDELLKDLYSGYSLPILRKLTSSGLIKYIFPSLTEENLSDSSLLGQLLSKIDAQFSTSNKINLEILISAISICLINSRSEIFIKERWDLEDEEFLSNKLDEQGILPLGIPRRVREMILVLINDWIKVLVRVSGLTDLQTLNLEPSIPGRASKIKKRYDRLIELHRILPETELDRLIYKEIKRFSSKRH